MKRKILSIAGGVLAGALVLSGCSTTSGPEDPGNAGGSEENGNGAITSGLVPTDGCPDDAFAAVAEGEKIVLGVSLAQSGPIAVVDNIAKAIKAVFDQANAAGGVAGHQIELVVKDDAFETARAVANVRELIDNDKVMAIIGQVGTPLVGATQPFIERNCTPQLWVASGVEELAANPEEHPFTTSNLMPYGTEAALWIEALIASGITSGKIAMVNADDDRAEAFQSGVKAAIEGKDFELVGVQEVSASAPSVDAQVNATLASSPDVVFLGTSTSNCPPLITGLRRAGFEGEIMVNNTCSAINSNFVPAGEAANGVKVLIVTDDPSNEAIEVGPELEEYFKVMEQYGPSADVNSSYTAGGYQMGILMLEVLANAAELEGGLNRVNIMNAAWTVETEVPLGPTGSKAQLNWTEDPVWRDVAQLMEYEHGVGLKAVGDPINIQ